MCLILPFNPKPTGSCFLRLQASTSCKICNWGLRLQEAADCGLLLLAASYAAAFVDKKVRAGFVKKVFVLVALQLAFTIGIASVFLFVVPGE